MAEQPKINHLAVIVAAIVHFAVGAAWFTALAKPWIAGLRMTPEEIAWAQAHMSPVPYAVAFACNLLMAYALAWVIGRGARQSVLRGFAAGVVLGVGVAAAAIVTELAFERHAPSFIAISAGYPAVGMAIMGAIIGAWRKSAVRPTATAAAGK